MVRYQLSNRYINSVLSILKFSRSSFRYEVKVTTPHFQIATMSDCDHRESFLLDRSTFATFKFSWSWFMDRSSPYLVSPLKPRYLVPPSTPAPLMGTVRSRLGTFCQPDSRKGISTGDDVPTWVNLLEDVHDVQYQTLEHPDGLPSVKGRPSDLALVCISSKSRVHRMFVR
jgi:hypothetical protein